MTSAPQSAPARQRWFDFQQLRRPRILIALAIWMLLLHAIAIYLGIWFAVESFEFMSRRAAASNGQVSAESISKLWGIMTVNMVKSYLLGIAPVVTLLLGIALIVVRTPWWNRSNRWIWLIAGAIAGAVVGRSWYYFSFVIIGSTGLMSSPQDLSSVWDHVAYLLMIGSVIGIIWYTAFGVLQGVISALIFRRLVIGKS
jgi:hypothetical protein